MTPELRRERIRVWGSVAVVFIVMLIIAAIAPKDRSDFDARNAAAWEKQLRDANGPNWTPTKAEEAMLRSSAKVTAEKLGQPPDPDR